MFWFVRWCLICGSSFPTSDRSQFLCKSRVCKRARSNWLSRPPKGPVTKNCIICGIEFYTTLAIKVTCSKHCSKERQRIYDQAQRKTPQARAKAREYKARPEVRRRASQRARQDYIKQVATEEGRALRRKYRERYNSSAKGKATRAAYKASPEVKQRRRLARRRRYSLASEAWRAGLLEPGVRVTEAVGTMLEEILRDGQEE